MEKSFVKKIIESANKINNSSRYGSANYMITTAEFVAELEKLNKMEQRRNKLKNIMKRLNEKRFF